MEIVINKKTYILKPVNQYRRELFQKFVLPFYGLGSLGKKEKATFSSNLLFILWEFIKDEDKRQIGTIEKVKIKQVQVNKFVDWVNNAIVEYNKYIQLKNQEEEGKTEKIETVFAFLSRQYGWTFEYMQEMDELTLLKALNEACELANKERVDKINTGALIGAFSSGSKQAKRKIDEINREAKVKDKIEAMKNAKIEKKGEFLSEEELRNL